MGAFGFILESWATDPATTNPTVVPRVETSEKKRVKQRARASLWSKAHCKREQIEGGCDPLFALFGVRFSVGFWSV